MGNVITVQTSKKALNLRLQSIFLVQEIFLWRNPKNSAIALALSLLALILVAKFTFLSLLAWGSLLVLGGTLGFRIFKLVESQIKKTDGSNPFKPYLETDVNVPQEVIGIK